MKNSFFVNENQLIDWVEAAEDIKESFGINKALGYLIGEKFYNVVSILCSDQKAINHIDEQRKKTNNKSIQENGSGKNKSETDLDKEYKELTKRMNAAKEVLIEFSKLIRKTFEANAIRKYLNSNPRFGSLGHIFSEEQHKFWVEKGVVEHSVETEIEDAFIFGEMIKYLDIKMGWFD